ncbi:MAG: ligand-binding sensor domain-containing protein, partial [Bacteroidota bacterium]
MASEFPLLMLFLTTVILTSSSIAQKLPFRAYTTRDGLISNFVTTAYQDSRGYLWVGTDEGISIFDGERFRNIRFHDSVVVGYVNEIVESRREPGVMWVGTNGGGLIRLSNGQQTVFHLGPEPKSNNINSIIEMNDGTFWCATDHGLYHVQNGAVLDRVALDTLRTWVELTRSLDGTIWCCDEYRASIFHPETKTLEVPPVAGLPKDSILVISALPDSTVAIHVFRKKRAEVYIVRNNRILRTIETIVPAATFTSLRGPGEYWIGSASGLEMYRTGNGTSSQWLYTTTNGLPVNHLAFCVQDRDQNLWFGSYGSGLSKLSSQHSIQFNFPGMSPVAKMDDSLHVWVPSTHGVYEVWKDSSDQWKRHLHILGGPAKDAGMVIAMFQGDRTMWLMDVEGKIYRVSVNRSYRDHSELSIPQLLMPDQPLPPALSISLFVDSRGIIWYCLREGGLIGLDCSSGVKVIARWDYRVNTSLRDVRSMYEDRQGSIWIMGYDGENYILRRTERGIVLDSTDSVLKMLPSVPYRAVLQTRDGAMWFGSRYHGLFIYRNGTIKHLTTKDGMISNQIWSLTETKEGGILIGSQAGLMLMPNQNVDRFMSLQDYSTSSVGTVIAKPGILAAASAFELTMFTLPDQRSMTAAPDVRFTSLFVNGKEESLDRSSGLSSNENTLTIDYTAISFRNTSALRFQYRLEPLEKNWSAPSNGRTVTYANLPPGDYRFIIRAFSPEGQPGE